jgi:hypothetical protein
MIAEVAAGKAELLTDRKGIVGVTFKGHRNVAGSIKSTTR